MKWIETTISYLFPTVLLEGKPWRSLWEEKERNTFVLIARFFFPIAGGLYVGHYFFYDVPMDLQPIERWFQFRMSVATLSFATFAYYTSPLCKKSYYKLPAIATCWVYCYTQSLVTTWWDGTPWLFSFVFTVGTVMVARTSPLKSIFLATAIITTQTPALLHAGVPLTSVVSTGFVCLIVLMAVRTSYLADIRNFALNEENVSAQKKIIELNIEFADRLRAFIPKVIARRLENYVSQNRLTVLQAAVEVLKARKTNVTCLFSDIRGFTQGSKELESFVTNSVLPEMKACSDTVENYSGIPRKVGDLIFAYFDDESDETNTLRATLAGMEISRLNHDMNQTSIEAEIRRYILLSSGEAVVGNLGGLDSSIEITALGSPVNFLSRLDDLTKHPAMIELLAPGDLIICDRTLRLLKQAGANIETHTIDLTALGLTIRDFPETTLVHRIEVSDKNYNVVRAAYASNDTAETHAPDFRLTG